MEKYIMLCNVEKKIRNDREQAKQMLKVFPEMKSFPFGVMTEEREIVEGYLSLWIPKEQFLSAWVYYNYKGIKNGQLSIEDGEEYLSVQLRDGYEKSLEELQTDNPKAVF